MTLPLRFERRITTPTEITRRIKRLIDADIDEIWIKGEISNFTPANSGHLYFSLKDAGAAIRVVMWSSSAQRLRFKPGEGMMVEVRGKVTVYEKRGEYQLVAVEMNPGGLGELFIALEALKKKLAAEGLFEESRRKPLPRFPACIGVVTSPDGAAFRDIVRVARERWPGIQIILAPARVQGEGSVLDIVAGIRRLNTWGRADVLIVGRGGGSIEDLWSFNDEAVARAIAESRTPVVSAVGHETDVTLADLVADRRAATPSNAAEIVVPDAVEIAGGVRQLEARLRRSVVQGLAERRRRVESITGTYGFRRPQDFLGQQAQRVDELERRLDQARGRFIADHRKTVTGLSQRLAGLDPTSILSRGYCLVQRDDDAAAVVKRAAELKPGETVRLRFSEDAARARVEEAGNQ